ncbi:MAG: GGDEF domain-containing protein [Leptothrix sp. (in: b-proteobacteria)]
MRVTDQTVLEQIHINGFELANRKALLDFGSDDEAILGSCRGVIVEQLDDIVRKFYDIQTSTPELALLIGDSETLQRLHATQRTYILDLFGGRYELDYVNQRLRMGLVHKRIGLEPKYYVAALQLLMNLLRDCIRSAGLGEQITARAFTALDKIRSIDETLFFESYIRSLGADFNSARKRSEDYVRNLEEELRERTQQLEDMARIDPLTGLINRRHLADALSQAIRSAQRRNEPISVAFLDIDNLQLINERLGHQQGDEVLRTVGQTVGSFSRAADQCFRYGDDEFCVILPNCREPEAMNLYCRRLQDRLTELLPDVGLNVGICSCGPESYLDPDEMLGRADARMYEAKYALRDTASALVPDESTVDLRRLVQRGGTG